MKTNITNSRLCENLGSGPSSSEAKVKALMSFIFIVTLSLIFHVNVILAQDGMDGNLVSYKWLQNNLHNSNILIIDASPNQVYASEHIAGAVNADLLSYGIQEMTTHEMEQMYQSWGVSPGKKIILYDQGGTNMATSQFFSLYYHGFPAKDLFILDGGLSKWKEAGLPVTKEPTTSSVKGTFTIPGLEENSRVKLPEILTASGDTFDNALIEGLDANWHFGQISVFDRCGHIPNGILMAANDFYNADKTFKSSEEIKKMLDYMGITNNKQIYTYCGGGINASVPFFAIKFIVDYPKVKLYKESEMGWLKDERGLPYWTYDAPYLMRETGWLQFWGGKMLRMYSISDVSILDLRQMDAFNKGHIPFALNISSEEFANNISNPGKLSDLLGQSGVHASDEAVIISGAGLTKESALAFAILEKLGQKKVSILIDSLDKYARLGFNLTNEKTVVGGKKNPHDLSITPANYSGNLRSDVIIADPESTKGLYPKVFIASGKDMPSKIRDGKIVHVAYSDLLNDGGTPKAAKDIWNILAKAGVPRYAELVCVADDPAEAAVNYFILKLMGFPDVKILAM